MNTILKPCGIQDAGQIHYIGIEVNEKYVAEIIYMPDYQTYSVCKQTDGIIRSWNKDYSPMPLSIVNPEILIACAMEYYESELVKQRKEPAACFAEEEPDYEMEL